MQSLERAQTRVEVYAIKVTLLGTRPPVWRRMLAPRDITLRNLHRTLQTVMGWTNSHLHQFVLHRTDPTCTGSGLRFLSPPVGFVPLATSLLMASFAPLITSRTGLLE